MQGDNSKEFPDCCSVSNSIDLPCHSLYMTRMVRCASPVPRHRHGGGGAFSMQPWAAHAEANAMTVFCSISPMRMA